MRGSLVLMTRLYLRTASTVTEAKRSPRITPTMTPNVSEPDRPFDPEFESISPLRVVVVESG